MLSSFFLDIIFTLVSGVLSVIPQFAWDFDLGALEPFLQYIHLVTYFFPMPVVTLIFAFYLWLQSFKNSVAILRTIWDILPLV